MLNVINLLLGGSLLVAGRKLFWLFVGALGFITGMQLATRFTQGREGIAILIGIVVGIIFAVLAILLQTLAIGAAGFFAGGIVLTAFSGMLGIDNQALYWIIYVVGGLIGIVLVMFLLDWALITLSSLAGASLVVQGLFPERSASGVVFLVLFVIGVVMQASVLRGEEAQKGTTREG